MDTAGAAAKRDWPSTPAWPLLGHIPDMIKHQGLIPYIEQAWRELGDCFEFCVAGETIKVVVHPREVEQLLLTQRSKYIKGASYDPFRRLAGEGLISAEGELWRRQRRIIQPSFKRATITELSDRMLVHTERMFDRWAARSEPELDVHAELMHLTLEITGDTLFGLQLGDDESELSTRVFTDAITTIAERITAIYLPPRWLPTPGNIRSDRAFAQLERAVMGVIELRRASGRDGDDFLGALLRARDEQGRPLDDALLRDEVITMFLAGHETTAVSLGWTLWLLTQNPEVRARLIREIREVLGDRPPTSADLPKLGYVRQVFYESMRVISPVWAGARNCIEPDTINGYPVEVGDRVMNFIWLTHKHPQLWVDPDRFDPDRFAPGRVAQRHKFAYMPFTVGPRKCIGEHFATLESVLTLTRLFQRFDIEAVEGFEPEMDFQLTTRPRNGLRMRLTGLPARVP